MTRTTQIALVLFALLSTGLTAQEQGSSGASNVSYGPGWTFTPGMGFTETYDDNISQFGIGTADEQNDDYIASISPAAELHYGAKHTALDLGYHGSFLELQHLLDPEPVGPARQVRVAAARRPHG